MKPKLLISLLVCASIFLSNFTVCNAQTGLDFTSSSPITFVKGLDNASLDLTQGTIEAWIKTADAGSTYRGILVKQAAYGMFLYDNELIAYDSVNSTELESNVSLNDDQWHHVAITFDNDVTNGSQFYVDGQPVLSFTYEVQESNTEIAVGKGNAIDTDFGQQFNGQIDNARVWNTIRTDAEILFSYNKCLVGTESGLVMRWQFEEGSGILANDTSGNGNSGTLINMTDVNWVTGYNCESNSLIAHYPFNGNANDESGLDNHGTPNGATLTADRFGNTNSAYYFDGVSNYISITDNPNINVQTGESYTISYWTKHSAQNNGKYMISKYMGSIGVEPSYGLGTGSNGDSYSWFEFTAGNGIENRGDIDLNDNNWHHITSVFKSGESITIYVDGELDIQHPTTYTGSITNLHNLTIGCGANLARFYNGSIDDIKIYKRALSLEEIKNEASDLIAHYPFNGNANDESGNNLHGTINGATLTMDRFNSTDSAYSFDGNDIITIAHDDLLNSNSELSISVWVKPNSQQNAMILGKSDYNSNTNYLLRTNSSGFIQFEYKDFANSNILPLIVNDWNHIAVVSQTDNTKLVYINGVLATHTGGSSPFGLVNNALSIGARSGAEFFNGSIDDLRIYKSALTETEVLSLYNNNTLDIVNNQLSKKSELYIYNNTLFVNPASNLSEIKSISIYNLLGQNIFQTKVIQNVMTLNFLNQGIYILKAEHIDKNTITKKFVIQ